ncbi:hypothetical protein J437_LFUL010030, partial [Ladona fulva]
MAPVSHQSRSKEQKSSTISKMFNKYDVIETSYHFLSERIDLHLLDDPGAGRSSHPDLRDGAAFQIELRHFQVDFYPYHRAIGDRKHWPAYREGVHTRWLQQSLSSFRATFLDLGTKKPGTSRTPSGNVVKNHVLSQLSNLMTTCIILRIENFTLYRVTTSKKKSKPREFIAVPPPKFFVQMFPIQINFDIISLLWLNSFALNLAQSLSSLSDEIPPVPYVDVKIEAILPRLILESRSDYLSQRDRPKALHFQTSRALITNMRSPELGSLEDLSRCLEAFQEGRLFYGGSTFPSLNSDFQVVIDKFLSHLNGKDHLREAPKLPGNSVQEADKKMSPEMLWIEAKDVWFITCDPVWAEFHGASATGGKTVPFFDAFPLRMWAYMRPPAELSFPSPQQADIHVLAHISALVSVQLNHYQYLFLLRLSEDLREALSYLANDTDNITARQRNMGGPSLKGSLVVGAILPQVEVSLVMPSQTPGREEEDSVGESSVVTGEGQPTMVALPLAELTDTTMDMRRASIAPSESTSPLSEDPGPELHWATDFPEVMAARTNGDGPGPSMSLSDTLRSRQSTDRRQQQGLGSNSNASVNSSGFNMIMRKGFTNLMTSIDSTFAIRPSTGMEDSSDTVSLRSDGSSEDSEMYVMVNIEAAEASADAIFRVPTRTMVTVPPAAVEIASEVTEEEEEDSSSSTNCSLRSLCKRKDLVSMTTFKLRKVEFIQQSEGFSSSMKVQVDNIVSEECGSIPWDEFQ